MYRQGLIFADMFDEFRHSKMVFPYPALGWVEPVGYGTGVTLLMLNRVACFLTCIGLCTRAATMLLFVTFTYLFVLCESNRGRARTRTSLLGVSEATTRPASDCATRRAQTTTTTF